MHRLLLLLQLNAAPAAQYLLYVLILPFRWTTSPFFSQLMRGGGTPSAWHMKRAVPALGRVWLSGLSTMEGGTEMEGGWVNICRRMRTSAEELLQNFLYLEL